ncbi:hypothetical protein KKG45_06250 [bacterium]|nr:hypothetical protein [bacterium]MBU1072829.1 hypothetical protein [bacterium]MBU1674549.1 hypothetical protein [bacterium]
MIAARFILATAAQPGAPSWWKLIGAFLIVFALLIVFLKLLGRMQRGGGGTEASLLRIHALGPRRSVEVLRCGETVYTLYRSDQAMVLLSQEPFDPRRHAPPPPSPALAGWLDRLRGTDRRHRG